MQRLSDNASAVGDVLAGQTHHDRLQTQIVRTDGLVAEIAVGVFAFLVNTEGTGRIRDVEKGEVIADPRASLLATGDKIHRVCGCEGKGLVLGQEEVVALFHPNIFIRSRDATAHDRILDSRFTSDKVVVSVVSDVVGTTGRVDLEKVDAAPISGHADTYLVAVNSARPVGDAVSVDLATKHTNRRGKDIVGSDRDCFMLERNTKGIGDGRKDSNDAEGREHSASVLPLVGSVILKREYESSDEGV